MYLGAVLLLGLAAAAAGSGYIVGREYVYEYDGQLFSGFPDKKQQFAVDTFKTRVRIQPRGGYAVYQIDNIQYSVANEDIEDIDHHDFKFKEVPNGSGFLGKPFKVYYKHGRVTKFEVSKDEPVYSVNVKRGLISLFNLNFDEAENTSHSDVFEPTETAHYYKVYEDGVLGDCETQYVIEHHPSHSTPQNNIVLNVTKSRNYHKCRHAPNHHYSTFYGHECGREKPHTLHGNGYAHYDIRGDRHHYVIEKANAVGEVIYVPYPLDGQPSQVSTSRHAHLLEEHDVTEEIQITDELHLETSLQYDIPFRPMFKEKIDLKKPHYLYHLHGGKAPMEEIKHLVEKLHFDHEEESHTQKAREHNYPALFLELVRAVSTLGYSEIEELFHIYVDASSAQRTPETAKLFLDVLINTGTNPTILFAKNMIIKGEISGITLVYYLQMLPTHVKELTESLLDEIEGLCEDEHVRSNHNAYSSCYLSLSRLVYDNCVAHFHPESGIPPDEHDCPSDIPRKYFKHIAEKLDHTHDDEFLEVVYLKSIGILGVKESVKYLKPHINNDHESTYLRNSAIWALKNVAHNYRELIRDILVPLYYNHSENYELRISAFILITMTQPDTHELEAIAHDLIDEEDCQVRSFVYSMFEALVNSTHPCHEQLSHDVRYALHVLKESHQDFHYDYSYSHLHLASGYDHHYDFGGSTLFAYVASDAGYIPKELYLGLNDYIGGKSLDSFSIGVKQYGVEKLTDLTFSPHSKGSFLDLFKKRARRDTHDVGKEGRDIDEKLKLPKKTHEPIRREFFLNYMGNSVNFLYYNDSTFANLFKEGALTIADYPALLKHAPKFTYRKFSMAMDKMYYIPSEIGVPIIFDYKQPQHIFYKNNKFELDVKPAFFKQDRTGPPTDIHLSIDGHFIFDKNLFASIGLSLPLEGVILAAGINRRSTISLPTKVDLNIDFAHHQIKTKWVPVTPHEVYHFNYEPYTVIDSFRNYLPITEEKSYLPVRREGFRKKVDNHVYHDLLGIGFTTHKDYDGEWNDYGSWFHFITEKDYREKFYYLYANPHFEPFRYDVVLEEAEKDPTKEVDITFTCSTSRFTEDDPKRHTPDEDFEEYSHDFHMEHLSLALRAEIVAHGPRERRVDGELIYTRDYARQFNKLAVYYNRSPFASHDDEGLKLCASAYVEFPRLDMAKFSKFKTLELDRTVLSKAKIHFGKDCHSDKKITIDGRIEASEEQLDLERKREEPYTVEHHNPYAVLYQNCLKETRDNLPFPKSCVDYLHLALNLHHYTFHIHHEHLTPHFIHNVDRIGGYIRHVLYDFSEHNPGVEGFPDHELHIEAKVCPLLSVADIDVKTSHRESHYRHVHVPHYVAVPAALPIEDMVTKKSAAQIYCLVQFNSVFTFDHYSYEIPPTDCYRLISKDSSAGQYFYVLQAKNALKYGLGKHVIEIHAGYGEKTKITVDDVEVQVADGRPFIQHDDKAKEPTFYISLRGFFYTIHSEKYGVIVSFFGNFVTVQASPFYRAKLTGLCGDYNGQKHGVYYDRDHCFLDSAADYANSLFLPSDTCTVPEVHRHCHDHAGHGCSTHRTKIVELTTGDHPQTCFSIYPVIECKAECEASSHSKKTIGFHCLPSESESTAKLVREQKHRVIHEVNRKSRDHEEDVEIDEVCHRK